MIVDLQFCSLFFFFFLTGSALGEDLLSCESKYPAASGYRCDRNVQPLQCGTFALFRTNSFYSSFFNLSSYLGINRYVLGEANGFSADTEFLPIDQPLIIPLDCKCVGGFFEAELTKTTIKGESFYSIAQSLEGLTTCKAIQEKNPNVTPFGLSQKVLLSIPLRCACPSTEEISPQTKLLLSYPVKQRDTIAALAISFNTTAERIIDVNRRSEGGSFRPEGLSPGSTLLIPLEGKPKLSSFPKPQQPDLGYPAASIASTKIHKKKIKMRMMRVYIAVAVVAFVAIVALAAVFLFIFLKRKRDNSSKEGDMELQKLSLSVRTTSKKKVSFEGSQNDLDGQIIDATPHKLLVETYTIEEIEKATEEFDSSNLIEDSVFHGRISGKNLAIKQIETCSISKIDFGLFNDAIHHHPNIIRLLGMCITEGPDSFLVFEYAKNGSLKDWLHGGLAMKNQFISSCDIFLTWNQRLRICLDVATAFQFMHHIMDPPYVHRNMKSRNIFLDEEFKAKVGNFGMARCVEDDVAKGYLAPEYLERKIIAPSIDIFAFGVILLEVLSGQTPIKDEVALSQKIKVILESENADELREWIDSALGENYSFDAAVTLANLARACVEEEPSLRPNAGEIVEKLSRLVEELLEGEELLISESSCKPLFKAASTSTTL
ncbi:protein LYK2 [Lycium barbarum]|uniref:protein LYK2 n=1 Tax=Lycium barbarum TaxID=112863 RepID=UPI00293ECA46|nr:protein LYK2 [Lycium barbarum]